MKMIPYNRSLVSTNEMQQAAVFASAEIERKLKCGKRVSEYPYAKAFFKFLNHGRTQILAKDIYFIDAGYNPRDRDGNNKDRYLQALDWLIESNGYHCCLPLSGSLRGQLFPAFKLQLEERTDRKRSLKFAQKRNQERKQELCEKRRYENLVAQANIDLAFQTPSTIAAWYSRWSQEDISEYDLRYAIMSWTARFPSLDNTRENEFPYCNYLWETIAAISDASSNFTEFERHLNALLVPNKLRNNKNA